MLKLGATICHFVISNLAGTAVANFLQLRREVTIVVRNVTLLVAGWVTEWSGDRPHVLCGD